MKHPYDEAFDQVGEAEREISTAAEKFLHFPWPALDAVVGGIGPGQVWLPGGYSGHGKTTFLMSAVDAWFDAGKQVFFMGLESQPGVLRTQWACLRLGLDAGDVLSGALAGRDDWEFTRRRLREEMGNRRDGVYFSPEKFVNAERLQVACEMAADMEADVVIIDHVDHLEGTGGLYEASVQSMRTLLSLAQELGLKVLAATQFNNEMLKGSRVGMHQAPSPTAVYMGGHKRQIASGMLGIYKPLRFDITPEQIQDFRDGKIDSSQVVEPGVMALSVMKHRLYGQREGKRVFLKVERGKVTDLPERDLYRTVDDDGMRAAL